MLDFPAPRVKPNTLLPAGIYFLTSIFRVAVNSPALNV